MRTVNQKKPKESKREVNARGKRERESEPRKGMVRDSGGFVLD